jgi:23S rRNA pseudouridine1911/1915/1917 synthase
MRQLLHARALGFSHPPNGEAVSWETPLPEDFQAVLENLETLEMKGWK